MKDSTAHCMKIENTLAILVCVMLTSRKIGISDITTLSMGERFNSHVSHNLLPGDAKEHSS